MFRNYDKNSIDSFIDWWVDVFFFILILSTTVTVFRARTWEEGFISTS